MVGPELPDLIAGIVSLISILVFVQFWKPPYRAEFDANLIAKDESKIDEENAEKRSTESRSSRASVDSKLETTEIENPEQIPPKEEGAEEAQNSGYTPGALEIVKPTLKESILAWSPWVLIVVIVIM